MISWLKIFALTYVIETPIYAGVLRRQIGWLQGLLVSLLLNLATHPVVWFVLPKVFENQVNYALFAEAWAVSIEALVLVLFGWLRKWERRDWLWCFGLSFVANCASATFGEVLYYVLDRAGIQLV